MMFHKPAGIAHELSDLSNISIALSEQLKRAGIGSPDALRATGAEAAWLAVQNASGNASIQLLLALEGGIQGVDWRALPPARRFELMRFAGAHLLPATAA